MPFHFNGEFVGRQHPSDISQGLARFGLDGGLADIEQRAGIDLQHHPSARLRHLHLPTLHEGRHALVEVFGEALHALVLLALFFGEARIAPVDQGFEVHLLLAQLDGAAFPGLAVAAARLIDGEAEDLVLALVAEEMPYITTKKAKSRVMKSA